MNTTPSDEPALPREKPQVPLPLRCTGTTSLYIGPEPPDGHGPVPEIYQILTHRASPMPALRLLSGTHGTEPHR